MKNQEKTDSLETRTIKKSIGVMILVGLFLVCLSSVTVLAWSTNTFNNSLTSETLFFTGSQNITRYLSVPNTVTALAQGYLNLSGFIPIDASLGLVGYWTFDDTTLDSKAGNNFSALNYVPGKHNNMSNFTNGNYAQTLQNLPITGNANRTINFWGKVNAIPDALSTYPIFSTGTDTALGMVKLAVYNGKWYSDYGTVNIQYGTNDLLMHMHTFTYNGTGAAWYTDGVYQGSTNVNLNTGVGKLNLAFDIAAGSAQGNVSIDELSVWNKTLTQSEITTLYNSGAGLYYPFTGGVDIIINDTVVPLILGANGTVPTTITVSNLASIINSYLNPAHLVGSNYIIPFAFHSDNAGNLTYSAMNFSNEGLVENSQNYNPTTTSGVSETYSINITYDSSTYSAISPILVYNNTNYVPSQTTGSGNNLVFTVSLVTPTISSPTSKTFYWAFALTNSVGDISNFNSTSHTQLINPLQVDNCSLYGTNILNFTLFDEDARTQLNGTIEVDVTFYSPGTGIAMGYYNNSFDFVANKGASRVCMNQTNVSLTMDYHAKYFSNLSFYPVEHKFAQNITVTTSAQVVNLYDLLDARSTVFQITLQSADLNSISGAVIDIQREYLPINQFISVESPLTDRYGTTIGHFVAEEVYYTFVVTKQGQVLGTFNRQLVKCQNVVTGDCRLTLNLIQATQNPTDFQTYGNITVNYLWSPSIRRLLTTWQSVDNAHLVKQNVTLKDNFGNTTICENSATGLSGSFICNVPDSYGNTTIISYIYSDDKFLGYAIFNLGDSASDIFGGTKVILGMLMYTTLTLLMIANPITLVIGAIMGMGFMMAFHIVDGGSFIGNSSIFLWFVVAGGIVIYHIAKRNY